jgi:hypothetical protein
LPAASVIVPTGVSEYVPTAAAVVRFAHAPAHAASVTLIWLAVGCETLLLVKVAVLPFWLM